MSLLSLMNDVFHNLEELTKVKIAFCLRGSLDGTSCNCNIDMNSVVSFLRGKLVHLDCEFP